MYWPRRVCFSYRNWPYGYSQPESIALSDTVRPSGEYTYLFTNATAYGNGHHFAGASTHGYGHKPVNAPACDADIPWHTFDHFDSWSKSVIRTFQIYAQRHDGLYAAYIVYG